MWSGSQEHNGLATIYAETGVVEGTVGVFANVGQGLVTPHPTEDKSLPLSLQRRIDDDGGRFGWQQPAAEPEQTSLLTPIADIQRVHDASEKQAINV